MKKSDSLKHQLAESLQAAAGHESPQPPEPSGRSQKCSITLYQTDLDILDRIRDHLRRSGIRNLSDSEAVRLACRTVTFDERLTEIYSALKRDDGRRRN